MSSYNDGPQNLTISSVQAGKSGGSSSQDETESPATTAGSSTPSSLVIIKQSGSPAPSTHPPSHHSQVPPSVSSFLSKPQPEFGFDLSVTKQTEQQQQQIRAAASLITQQIPLPLAAAAHTLPANLVLEATNRAKNLHEHVLPLHQQQQHPQPQTPIESQVHPEQEPPAEQVPQEQVHHAPQVPFQEQQVQEPQPEQMIDQPVHESTNDEAAAASQQQEQLDVKEAIMEPEVNLNVKNEDQVRTNQSNMDGFDKFVRVARRFDPLLLWGVLRPKILANVSVWDFMVDKTVLQAQTSELANVPSERLKILLNELTVLLDLVNDTLDQCCESKIKMEIPDQQQQQAQEGASEVGSVDIDDVVVPAKLMPFLGQSRSQLKLKSNMNLSAPLIERLFGIDDSLKPHAEDARIKEEDLRTLDEGIDDSDLLEFALGSNGNYNSNDIFNPPKPKPKPPAPPKPAVKRPEKPKQCEKCKKWFPKRQNYHFHRTRGKCPGVPQPPKFHKLFETKYYCVHPDCGSGDGEIRDTTPVFTSRGIYWKHLMGKHLSDADKVFQCDVCPEKFAYPEMVRFHMQQKHEKMYTCKYCGKNVSTRASLTKHERCHTGEKPYACDQCVYRTASLSSLARHKRCKHDEQQSGRKHVCELCGKGFFTPNALKEHTYTHSDVKRFSCHICGKQLKNDSCYRRHMVCVHGQKYTCDICGKDFSAINGINHHKREVHGIMY